MKTSSTKRPTLNSGSSVLPFTGIWRPHWRKNLS
jgi:hypothetical protein